MTAKTNCDNCNITFVGLEIPQGLLEGNPDVEDYKDITKLHKAAASYGWTPENKKTFGANLIYVKHLNDIHNHYRCKNCGHTWKD